MATDADRIKKLEFKIAQRKKRGLESPKMTQALSNLKAGVSQQQTQQATNPNQAGYNQNTGLANQYLGSVFDQLQGQGQFNPQGLPDLTRDYSADRQRAEQSVMDSFNRNMQPQFDRQNEQFRQQMAEQGIDEGSEKYKNMYGDMMQSQNNARQNAFNQAFQLGQSEQAQGFGQALSANNQMWGQQYNQYQMPLGQLNAMTPYYQQQGNQMTNTQNLDWQAQQAQLNRQHDFDLAKQQFKYQMQMPRGGGGGGGGGGGSAPMWAQYGFSSPLQYDQYKFNQQMLLQNPYAQQQPQYPSAGNSAVNGFAQGAGLGIMQNLGLGNTLQK